MHSLSSLMARLAALLGVVSLAACQVPLVGAACVGDDNCPRGQVCQMLLCVEGTPSLDGGSTVVDGGTTQQDSGVVDAGTIHWLSAAHALLIEVRLYDRLFLKENPAEVAEGGHFIDNINPRALEVVRGAFVEPSMAGAAPGTRVQFERLAYFCVDPDSSPSLLVVNRTITLRDSWAKQEGKG